MKTTIKRTLKNFQDCQNFRQFSVFTILTILSFNISAQDLKKTITRAPAAAIEEEVLTIPLEKNYSNEPFFAEDDAGIMKGAKETVTAWEEKEEYARHWNLESTGLYETPDTAHKRKYVGQKMLRYADKRLSGEMKKAEEGSALHTMSKVEKQLRPNASVPVSRFISLKFKARVLQGKAIVEVKNPWVELNATVSASGKAKVMTKKDFKQLGMTSGAEYSLNDSQWVAYVDQEVTKNIKARVSSTQDSKTMMFSNDADARVEMTASFPFNL